jgi:hypothetical protein
VLPEEIFFEYLSGRDRFCGKIRIPVFSSGRICQSDFRDEVYLVSFYRGGFSAVPISVGARAVFLEIARQTLEAGQQRKTKSREGRNRFMNSGRSDRRRAMHAFFFLPSPGILGVHFPLWI